MYLIIHLISYTYKYVIPKDHTINSYLTLIINQLIYNDLFNQLTMPNGSLLKMNARFIYVIFLSTCWFLTPANAQEIEAIETSWGHIYTIEENYPNSTMDGYNLYVPKTTNRSKPLPVIVFLQGGLGVGGDVDRILNWALPKMLKEPEAYDNELETLVLQTFIVIMPHIANGQFYENERAMRAILKEVASTYSVDSRRIYLTGLSRGGHGTWGLGSRMNDVFAAIAPICGSGRGITGYESLSQMPIWISHNTGDNVVQYRTTRLTVDRLEAANGFPFHHSRSLSEVKYKDFDRVFTSTPNDAHDAWTEFYNSPKLYNWFLKYKKE